MVWLRLVLMDVFVFMWKAAQAAGQEPENNKY